MLRGNEIKLYPSGEQKGKIKHNCHLARFVWNQSLVLKRDFYSAGLKLNHYHLNEFFNDYKEDKDWIKSGDQWALQYVIMRDMPDSFNRFFRGQNGYPKFKKKKFISSGSYYSSSVNIKVEKNKIKIPKIGWIKVRGVRKDYLESGRVKGITIRHDSDNNYYASILFDLPDDIETKFNEKRKVGIDLGVKRWIQLSTGETIDQVDLSKEIDRIKNLKSLVSKTKSHKKRKKIQIAANKTEKKIKNKKKNQIHQIANRFKKEGTAVVVEDLNTKKMSESKSVDLIEI